MQFLYAATTIAAASFFVALVECERAERPVDDPLACPWDVKICFDGTWVYREPERKCKFRDCWSSYTPPPEDGTFQKNIYDGIR